jgi:hypothetical protein
LLKEQIAKIGSKPNDMYALWAIAWVAKKRGSLDQYSALFTPTVLVKAAAHLKGDNNPYNASQAVRLFLLLGNQSLPTLHQVATSADAQARNLAKATIDALDGKREAFGYLCSKVYLPRTPFGPEVEEPAWLPDVLAQYLNRESYP